jgi:hypothetical protein
MVGCCLLPHLPCGSAASHPPSTFNAQKNAASIFHSSFFIMHFPADEFHAKDATIAKRYRPVGLLMSPPFSFFILHFSLCISLTAPSGASL